MTLRRAVCLLSLVILAAGCSSTEPTSGDLPTMFHATWGDDYEVIRYDANRTLSEAEIALLQDDTRKKALKKHSVEVRGREVRLGGIEYGSLREESRSLRAGETLTVSAVTASSAGEARPSLVLSRTQAGALQASLRRGD